MTGLLQQNFWSLMGQWHGVQPYPMQLSDTVPSPPMMAEFLLWEDIHPEKFGYTNQTRTPLNLDQRWSTTIFITHAPFSTATVMMEEKSSWWQEDPNKTPLKSGTTRLQGAPGLQVSEEFCVSTWHFSIIFWHLSNADIDFWIRKYLINIGSFDKFSVRLNICISDSFFKSLLFLLISI